MSKKAKWLWISSCISLVLFIALIVLIKFVDVASIGPNESEIGLSGMNKGVRDLIGRSDTWYLISELLGYVAIAVALLFVVLAVLQLIRRKSVKKIDTDLIGLGLIYVLLVVVYLLFEILKINYRPVLIDSELEASFPSSHTLLAVCILGTAIVQFIFRLQRKVWKWLAVSLCCVVMAVIVVGRLLSGVHWFTDIIGGIFIACALVLAYCAIIEMIRSKKEEIKNE